MASSDPFGLARLNFRRGYRHSSSRQPAPGIEEATAVWRSDKVLGSRTFWIVWREKEERMGKSRVAKVISKSQSGTQELKTLVNVREYPDHFVQFLALFEDANSIRIAVAHGDLSKYITMHPEQAKANATIIAQQILAGLVGLHERQICHRDLKPQVLILYADDD